MKEGAVRRLLLCCALGSLIGSSQGCSAIVYREATAATIPGVARIEKIQRAPEGGFLATLQHDDGELRVFQFRKYPRPYRRSVHARLAVAGSKPRSQPKSWPKVAIKKLTMREYEAVSHWETRNDRAPVQAFGYLWPRPSGFARRQIYALDEQGHRLFPVELPRYEEGSAWRLPLLVLWPPAALLDGIFVLPIALYFKWTWS